MPRFFPGTFFLICSPTCKARSTDSPTVPGLPALPERLVPLVPGGSLRRSSVSSLPFSRSPTSRVLFRLALSLTPAVLALAHLRSGAPPPRRSSSPTSPPSQPDAPPSRSPRSAQHSHVVVSSPIKVVKPKVRCRFRSGFPSERRPARVFARLADLRAPCPSRRPPPSSQHVRCRALWPGARHRACCPDGEVRRARCGARGSTGCARTMPLCRVDKSWWRTQCRVNRC